jgi:hypothetical protein
VDSLIMVGRMRKEGKGWDMRAGSPAGDRADQDGVLEDALPLFPTNQIISSMDCYLTRTL